MIKETFKGCNWLKVIQKLLAVVLDDGKEYTLTIKEDRKKRSKDANAYSWALTNKLAEKMLICGVRLSKEEMHAEMIHRYGQPELDDYGYPVLLKTDNIVNVAAFYPYAFPIGVLEDQTQWAVYRGSSSYDKAEMSLFIKGIVEECREQGIPTETPDEIARMISLMKEPR